VYLFTISYRDISNGIDCFIQFHVYKILVFRYKYTISMTMKMNEMSIHWSPWHSWNIVDSGAKHNKSNQIYHSLKQNLTNTCTCDLELFSENHVTPKARIPEQQDGRWNRWALLQTQTFVLVMSWKWIMIGK
jgi:hypothetical protein